MSRLDRCRRGASCTFFSHFPIPGFPRQVQQRAFYVFDAEAKDLRATLESYRVGIGARADESTLEAADVALEARLRAKGHHRVSQEELARFQRASTEPKRVAAPEA